MSISDFFENGLGVKLKNSRWSWGASNPDTKQVFLGVWEHDLKPIHGVEHIKILGPYSGGSSGFLERKRHVEELRNGAEGYGVLCTAKDISGSRRIKKFDHETLLKFGEIIEVDNFVFARIVDHIPVEDFARPQTSHRSVVPDLRSILAKPGDVTTREALANARVGQGAFRDQVLQIWGLRCCVTGSTTLDAIRASHIKPWRNSNDRERLDPYNGLSLIATLDALFDAGLIAFAPDGKLLISSRLDANEKELLGLDGRQLIRQPDNRTASYLAYHRKSIFRGTPTR